MHNGNGKAPNNGDRLLDGKTVLITGGTGSFGKKFSEFVLNYYHPQKLIIFSRDEFKQNEMRQQFPQPWVNFFIGDVRDRDRLYRAFEGVDYVIHAAAMKQVVAAEYNPLECIKTNIMGAANVIDAAIDRNVKKVIALSTDKAANPINLYGATKLCSDKLFVAGNSYSGRKQTRFSVVRYGNVVGSRGSVIPLFLKMRGETGRLPVTHPQMTRFWITLDQGVDFVIQSLENMVGGEIFVPKIPSMRILDLARAIGPECQIEITGIRPGEKLHEIMVPGEDARRTLEYQDYYVIQPSHPFWDGEFYLKQNGGRPCAADFQYSSDTNDRWLSVEDLQKIVAEEEEHHDPVCSAAD